MASAGSSLAQEPIEVEWSPDPFAVRFQDWRGSARAPLYSSLTLALLDGPHSGTSMLRDIAFSGSDAIARFEQGDGTIEQQLSVGARGSRPLPLPFLWSVRLVSDAAAALDLHGRSHRVSAAALPPSGVLSVCGEPRLNAAILRPHHDEGALPPDALSLASTLKACLGCVGVADKVVKMRPILPFAVLRLCDEARARVRAGGAWQSELELLGAVTRRMHGPHAMALPSTPRTQTELVEQQLWLLPALERLEGAPAVDAFFAARAPDVHRIGPLSAAFSLWRAERRLAPSAPLEPPSFRECARRRESDSRARVAQARFEFARGRHEAGLLLAIDAARMSPDAPDAWLALGQMRGGKHESSRALCFAEAICAARGDATVLKLVERYVGLSGELESAAYFRTFGDAVLAAWLENGRSVRVAMRSVN